MPQILDILICPLCGGALDGIGKSLVCTGGVKKHNYDVAKEGYVNLLPPGKGKNAHTGDDAEMIRARCRFLQTGAYDGLSDEVSRLIARHTDCTAVTFVDSGCGEGYHTRRIAKNLRDVYDRHVLCAAFDASKHGAASGAKAAYRENLAPKGGALTPSDGDAAVFFFAGNIFSLPLRNNSCDSAVSMFAPIAWDENRRILKSGGVLVVAASGRDHLQEMRGVIYDEVIKKDPDVLPAEGFTLAERTSVRYTHTLRSSEEISDLFGMTPFCYKTPREAAERLTSMDNLTVTVHTEFFVFRKDL